MTRDWHETFKVWSKPPSEREEEKGSNAATLINKALRDYPGLQSRNFQVYATGSYRNNTNVRQSSDIDIAVVSFEAFYSEYPSDGSVTREMMGFTSASYGLVDFREDVGKALSKAFGSMQISSGDKTFNVHETRNRLDADVTAFCEHRRYTGRKNFDQTWHFYQGVEMRPRKDPQKRIINWHQQHYDEGVARNTLTKRRFKRIVRILKRVREDMQNFGTQVAAAAAKKTPSFLIECLVYNASDECFNLEEGGYYQDTRAVITQLWNATKSDDACSEFLEVSRMKYLFRNTQPWTRADAHEFLLQAWQHVGFK